MSFERSKFMFKDVVNNKNMLEGAYRKLKSYYYYNKNFLFMRKKIAEFESDRVLMDKTFEDLAYLLCHPTANFSKNLLEDLYQQIDYYVIPKKFDTEPIRNNSPITNTIQRDKKMKTVNFFINAPIELHILDALWSIFLAKMDFDNSILSYDVYGNTINMSAMFSDNKINYQGRTFFNRYFNKYCAWRNNAFDILENNYKKHNDSVLISLDIKSYFYSVVFDFNKLIDYFNSHELLSSIRTLTKIIENVFQVYFSKIVTLRNDWNNYNKRQYPLPIGLFSSMILGNIYLKDFDSKLSKHNDLIYYGRYVDDILIVANKTINKKDTNNVILESLFVNTDIFIKRDDVYYLKGYPKLCIQADKIKIIYIDHSESRAIIDIYNDNIRIYPSQTDPLPDSDLDLSKFDEVAYSVENFTKENKIRDIGKVGVDAFKVGKYFSALAYKYARINTRKHSDTIENINSQISQIEKFFTGSQAIEFYSNWLNYMYFLVITERTQKLKEFVDDMKNRISAIDSKTSLDQKMFCRRSSINKRLKENLKEHLDICLKLALCLNVEVFKKRFKSKYGDVIKFIDSNMFDHNLIAFPLANYFDYNSNYVSLTKMDLKDIGEYPEKIEESFKFKWSPRFIHYDELLLLLFYHYHRENKKGSKFSFITNSLLDKYKTINYMDFDPFEFETPTKIEFDDYLLRRIKVPNQDVSVPEEINIAVGSVNISFEKCLSGLKRWDNISNKDKSVLYSILKETYNAVDLKNQKPMLLVLPELYFPIYWIGELIRFAKRSQVAIVTGLQYMGDDEERKYNYIATVLPFSSGKKGYKNAFLYIREKNDYSPIEFKELAKHGYYCQDRERAEYQIFLWQGIKIAPLVCYELTDVMIRALLKGRCDIIAAPVFNKDTTYFSNIIDSTVRDLHICVVQANTSFYGDSRITGPYDRDSKDIFKIKGGDNDHVVIGTLQFKKLIDYQSNYHDDLNKEVDKIRYRSKVDKKKRTKPDIKPLSARYRKK